MTRLWLLLAILLCAACANEDQRRADYHPAFFLYTHPNTP